MIDSKTLFSPYNIFKSVLFFCPIWHKFLILGNHTFIGGIFLKTKIKTSTLKSIWRFGIILLLNLLIIALVINSPGHEVFALSKYGSTGDEVRQIQIVLKEQGFYTKDVDGIYGSGTKNAVIEFQKSHDLAADGIAGPNTLNAMGLTSETSGSPNGQFSSSDLSLLARVISAEARGEPYTGQVAVGAVILNRIEHPSFPNTLGGVIYQPGAFSCLNDGQFNQPVSDSAKRAAEDAINGWDPSGGAIYYYNPEKSTNQWILSRPVITVIGGHRFCS